MSQRPANVKKDYITQADWLVWHRLTWSNDTKVVRRVLGSEYEDAVEGLATGEAFLQADFLDPAVRRIQFRRKETFDAGATPTLDDVKRPELKSVSDDLVAELEEISEAADRRQDELAKRERRIEELEAEIEELEQDLARSQDVNELAERLTDAIAPSSDGEGDRAVETIKADVMEVREAKREAESELADVRDDRDRLAKRVDELEAELDERDPDEDLIALRDDVTELYQRHADVLDVEDGGRVAKLERELGDVRDERDDLKRQVQNEFDDVDDLLAHETIQSRVEEVATESRYSSAHSWDAVTALAGTEWVGKDAVVPYMDLGESGTGDVLRELNDSGLVEKRRDGNRVEFRLDRSALESLIDAHRKRERLEAKRRELRATDGGDEADDE